MIIEFVSKGTLRDKQYEEKKGHRYSFVGPYIAQGEMGIINTGNPMQKPYFTAEKFKKAYEAEKAGGEMLSKDLIKDFLQHSVVNLSEGRAEHPALYPLVYEEIKNAEFMETVDVHDFIGLKAAFGVVQGGESVPLADYEAKKLESVKFLTYAAGYSIVHDWLLWNKFWRVEQANKALGEAYNAILDHLCFSPIINHSYSSDATTEKESGYTGFEQIWRTLYKALKDAADRVIRDGYRLRPTIALCNTSTAIDVEMAIKGLLQSGTQLGSLGQIKTVISYDGWNGSNEIIDEAFPAPEDGEVYLIEPKKGFKALVKEDITQLKQRGNILNLSEMDVVQFFTRAFIADVENSVHKVKLV